MAKLPVTKGADNSVLRTVSAPVKKIDKKLKKLVQDMVDTMMDLNGVGIAAPQVGVNLQLAVARLNVDTKQEALLVIINPEITDFEEFTLDMEEGCLSLPGKWGSVPRYSSLTVTFQTLKGDQQTLHLEAFNARVIQHEVDHLNGKLFIDHCKKVKEESRGARHEN